MQRLEIYANHQEMGIYQQYHSWERGLNEHTNGLIREFYPKSTNFKIVKEEDFQRAVDFINHRPRKSSDYRTPYEVFFASSEPVAFPI
jgi:IS30 family transposase